MVTVIKGQKKACKPLRSVRLETSIGEGEGRNQVWRVYTEFQNPGILLKEMVSRNYLVMKGRIAISKTGF